MTSRDDVIEPTADEIKRVREVTRPIVGIENRTAIEVFDMMCDRVRRAAIFAMNRRASPPKKEEGFQAVIEAREAAKGQLGTLREAMRLRRERASPPASVEAEARAFARGIEAAAKWHDERAKHYRAEGARWRAEIEGMRAHYSLVAAKEHEAHAAAIRSISQSPTVELDERQKQT